MESGLVVALLLLLALGSGSSSSTNGNGTLPPNGGGADVPGRKRGPDGRGDVWRIDDDLPRLPSPQAFDYAGNGIYFDPECGYVIEGDLFWPDPNARNYAAEEASTVAATLNLRPDNTILGWVDYLVDQQGIDDPIEIVWMLVDEVAPLCADVDPDQWGESMQLWFNDFLDRVTAYVDEGVIEFGGEAA